jgi:carboxylesterase
MHEQSMARPSDGWRREVAWRRIAAWLRDAVTALARRVAAPPRLPERTAEETEALRVARAAAERRYAFRMEGRRIGCLLVHGLTSTPQSMRALGEYLAAHGVDVEAVLLPGHGTTPEDLEATSWESWYDAVRAALDRLRPRCDRVFVCGQSMGGALALRAAAREPVDGVASLSGFLYLRDWRLRFLPFARRFVRWRKCIGNDIADPAARDEVCYDRLALRTVEELVELGAAAKQDLPRITVPALVMQSRVDHVVPPDTADFIYDHIGAADRELVRLEHSYHVISMDYEREIVAERVLRFLRRVAYAESARRR